MIKSFILPVGICIIVSFFACNQMEEKQALKSESAEGSTNPKGRRAWELQRLSDPATGKIPPFIREKELAFASTLPNDANTYLRSTSSANWIMVLLPVAAPPFIWEMECTNQWMAE
ncbi:MAG: hypothetical protein IPP71_07750 [Bacteroidetes bacterium]|nr:hypothetical protein [Bacteroidota bacterium]